MKGLNQDMVFIYGLLLEVITIKRLATAEGSKPCHTKHEFACYGNIV